MKQITKIFLILAVITLPIFAKSVATVTALKGDVNIKNALGSKKASLGDRLEEKDSVITTQRGKAQLIFLDETIVTIGKNTNFSIAKYLYEENKEVEFGIVKGVVRTITGKIGKVAPQKFKVKTKTATIGIRGTNFTVIVDENGAQKIYCSHGAVSVTYRNKTYIVQQGYSLYISADGEVTLQLFNSEELLRMQKENFGSHEPLKGTVIEDKSELDDEAMFDTTRENIEDGVKLQQGENMQDALQTQPADTVNQDLRLNDTVQ